MIESRYWKEHLEKYARSLRIGNLPFRWSERALCNFERNLILHFFSIRKLIELHKLSSKVRSSKMTIFLCQSRGVPVTRLNRVEMWDLYEFDNQVKQKRSVSFVANQFIHSYLIHPYRDEKRRWEGVFVCSDFEKNNAIFRIPLSEIRDAFLAVAKDHPTSTIMTYDPKVKDYRVELD